MNRYLVTFGALAIAVNAVPASRAIAATTILTFAGKNCIAGTVEIECNTNHDINPAYGDGPGVDVSYRAVFANGALAVPSLQYRPFGSGDLLGSLISNTGPGVGGEITFAAKPGYELTLLSLDAGCRNNATGCRNLPIRVGEAGSIPSLYATLANPVGGHSSLTFSLPYSTLGYTLRFGPDGYNGSLDNIAFDVRSLAPVPEPSTWSLMILGFGIIGSALRRNGKRTLGLRFAGA